MKQGGDHTRAGGFTIAETLIVLAVTGALFAVAVALVSGKQNKTQFMTAANNFKQQLQQVSNETASGYSQSNGVQCTAGTPPTLITGSTGLGTNGGCMFIGKVLQLGIGTAPNNQAMHVFPIVGNRLAAGTTQSATSLAQAYPVALAQNQGGTDLALENGLWLDTSSANADMVYVAANDPDPDNSTTVLATRGIGFLSTLSDVNYSSGNISGGSTQQLSLYAVTGSSTVTAIPDMKTAIDATLTNPGGGLTPVSEIRICLESAGTKQSALFTIGGTSDNPVGVRMKIFYTMRCT